VGKNRQAIISGSHDYLSVTIEKLVAESVDKKQTFLLIFLALRYSGAQFECMVVMTSW
jgi:hypothetical protein